MKLGKWVLAFAAIVLCLSVSADAQTLQQNQLCIHSGSEYYSNGGYFGYPNFGSGRYFPSFAHWSATSHNDAGNVYPWHLGGWAWGGMMANAWGPTWYFETGLMESVDNPHNAFMSFDYPKLFCDGTVPASGFPQPIYGGVIPTGVSGIGGYGLVFPSSQGGFDAYLNFFAVGNASWSIPSGGAFYGYSFGFTIPCASALTLPSNSSVWENIWLSKGPYGQYCLLDGNNMDCLGTSGVGNKGRNYSLTCDYDNGYLWGWTNQGGGTGLEWAMCLFVCDAVTVPVNSGNTPGNPFFNYGFDVGTTTLTPYLSSNCVQLGFMTDDYQGAGTQRAVLAAFGYLTGGGTTGPYGSNWRIPHAWDSLTNIFLQIIPFFMHTDRKSVV